jgi:hypothetical protein
MTIDLARRLLCESDQFHLKGSIKQFGWLQAPATHLRGFGPERRIPALFIGDAGKQK